MQFGCWRFLRKDQKKDPFPFLSYERKSYRLIIVAWKQIPVSSVLVHFPSSLDEFIHLFHSNRVLDEFIHLFHSTRVLDEFIHLFHSTCVLDEFIHLFHSTLPTKQCCLSRDVKSAWHHIGAQGVHLSCLNSGIME
jgi:hypothetical protein